MNKTAKAQHAPRDASSEVKSTDLFIDAGYSPEAAAAIVSIDATMQRIRRGFTKREFVAEVLKQMGNGIDLQQLDVMSAVSHWHPATPDDADREVTVGTIAERLGIDPSRASRLVSDVVDKGYIRREASQADSRRIVLVATEKGWEFGEEFRRRKGEMLARALKTWSEDELVLFDELLDRYSRWGREGLKELKASAES
jgi:DNA-binding MarR family transcriptional regulator